MDNELFGGFERMLQQNVVAEIFIQKPQTKTNSNPLLENHFDHHQKQALQQINKANYSNKRIP